MRRELSVAYCGNRKVFPMILLSVLSLAEHSSIPVNVYIATMDLSETDPVYLPITKEQCGLLDGVLKAGCGGSAHLLRADEAYQDSLRFGKNEKTYYTPYAQLRLFLDTFDLPDDLLYLDTDVMCSSDPVRLFEYDISGVEFAAVRDHMGKIFLGRDYFNSGVMYLNLEKIRETGLFVRSLELIKKQKMMFADQSALNNCVQSMIFLPRAFNEQRGVREDTVFKHFCRGIRWFPFFRVYNVKQSEREKVHKFLKITAFDDIYKKYDEIAATCDIL